MATTIPDLWAEDITVTVLPPLAVLKAQEGLLAQKTQGLLQAKLTCTESDKLVQYQLDLVAPSLNFYRERLLTATHEKGRYYPVVITAECFLPKAGTFSPISELTAVAVRTMNPSLDQRRAATEEEFIRLVREVLHSADVRSLIQSLIARINELPVRDNGQPQEGP